MHKIEASKLLKKVMSDHFIAFSDKSKKVAWCTSVGPAELLRSFGFEVYFPENHGALLGTSRLSTEFIPIASTVGYSSEICSYLTSDIGSYLSKNTPLTKNFGLDGVPKPDLLVYNTNQCREVQDWLLFYAKEFNCPIVGIQSPRHLDEVKKSDIDNVVAQMKAMIPVCEQVSENKFDLDKFKETLKLSKEATLLWKQSLETAKNIPAPISFFDSTIHMGPIVVLRGTEIAKTYYETLLKELNTYVDQKSGIIENEQTRIYWEGMPIWGKLRMTSELFASKNAAVVASTYCNSWIFDDFDENEPFESSALAYSTIFINMSEPVKFVRMKKLIEDYKINGIVFHDSKTCFNNSNSRFGLPQRLKDETGVEVLTIEGDLCDLRFFSEAQSVTKIETFIEQML
ncbi:MAG: 2-hydroxyacyl-CoA dehydratase family protein [Candidatus Kapabacteria bacterium]|nr:2-hydroxyacyl-CoA dehydratase family protein [Candidatus Kapabacteria bacterium]